MPKNSLNWNLVPGIELSPEIPTENMSQVWWRNSSNSEFTVSHIVSDGPTITYLPNICFSIFMPIAFLPSKIPKPYLQQSLFFLCWKGEHFGHFGEPPSFHGSFPRICVVKFLFDSDTEGLGWGLRFCISKQVPGDASGGYDHSEEGRFNSEDFCCFSSGNISWGPPRAKVWDSEVTLFLFFTYGWSTPSMHD